MRRLIYGTESSIYKENKSCDQLTDGRSPSVALMGHKWALAIRQPRCQSVTTCPAQTKLDAHVEPVAYDLLCCIRCSYSLISS